jgi:tripartite-type tricarboxylate transporter receptor subunit TctC
MLIRRVLLQSLTAAILTATSVNVGDLALAQTGTIKFVVPFGAGTSIDILARLLAEQIGQKSGLTAIVENRPGAGTIVASEAVANAAPNGDTLLFIANPLVINPHLRKVSYDPLTSFEAICHLVNVPNLIVVDSASPYRGLADLVDAARAKPGQLTLAAVGPGTASQVAFELLKREAHFDMTFVPFSGTPQAINSLLGEHVTSVLAGYPDVIEQVKSGKLRALAVASLSRIETLPDVPTVAESGYKGFQSDLWYGVAAPAHTPKATVAQLIDQFATALDALKAKRELVDRGLFPTGRCGAEFGAFLQKEFEDYGRVIRQANMKVD